MPTVRGNPDQSRPAASASASAERLDALLLELVREVRQGPLEVAGGQGSQGRTCQLVSAGDPAIDGRLRHEFELGSDLPEQRPTRGIELTHVASGLAEDLGESVP